MYRDSTRDIHISIYIKGRKARAQRAPGAILLIEVRAWRAHTKQGRERERER